MALKEATSLRVGRCAARKADGDWICLSPLDAGEGGQRFAVNGLGNQLIWSDYQHNFCGTAGIRTLDQRGPEYAINWLGLKGVADSLIGAGKGSVPIEIRDASDETFTPLRRSYHQRWSPWASDDRR